MIQGLRGSLLSHEARVAAGFSNPVADRAFGVGRRSLAEWHAAVSREGGPAWSARIVFDRVAVPVCRALGFELVVHASDERLCRGSVRRQGLTVAAFVAFGWGREPGGGWRDGVRVALGAATRWCYCFNGPTLRIVDTTLTHSRSCVDLQLSALLQHEDTFAVLWNLLVPSADGRGLDEAVIASERYRLDVRADLQEGVLDALVTLTAAFSTASPGRKDAADRTSLLDESLVIVYRVLFLLFAEARGLVPVWHPVYREAYTIESLRTSLETGRRVPGLWKALQAMSRLAHAGCRAGTLRVPPFNGRLFSPEHARLAATARLDDDAVREALLALTTRRTAGGRRRITFADLGVEHLGGVYERVLDFDLDARPGRPGLVRGRRRRLTGSFYTPRSLTEFLVRRTLAPLVEEVSPEQILALRIVDPSMGSGAFLVAACRYLAAAYENALLRDGGLSAFDLSEADRAGFRRVVAQRTLFGVDINPMAVQLARLSLWLATLCADRPLTFFDHHLRTGNSLVGATLTDITHVRSGRRQPLVATPLLPDDALDAELGRSIVARMTLTTGREDTLEEVRGKEALLERVSGQQSPLGRLMTVCDLWCAGWFDPDGPPVERAALGALLDHVTGRSGGMNAALAAPLLKRGHEARRRERFFHWELEFPEVFRSTTGEPLPSPGFDAVLGNPPWEMLRADAGPAGVRLTRFARGCGAYRLQGQGHTNLYQLFLERSLSLVRPGGRLGLVLPSGLASDRGSAALRRFLLDHTAIDSFTSVENREGLFPIHRGLRFVLTTATRGGGPTRTIPLRTGVLSAPEFDRLPDRGPDSLSIGLSRHLVERFSGDQVVIPELRTGADVGVLTRALAHAAPAADPAGWHVRFGRELNATEDKAHFTKGPGGMPVVEGKHLQPFTVDLGACSQFLPPAAARLVAGGIPYDRPRLAYRDVASATNRLTLIAAVLPAGTITTHTLFCLKTALDEADQHVLAGLFNSFAANYLVRLRVTTHVTVAVVESLPLPRPERGTRAYASLAELSRRLAAEPGDAAAQARLQALAARLYGLDAAEFAHVLSTFPLIDDELKAASMAEYSRTL
jgi:hypothetical protein